MPKDLIGELKDEWFKAAKEADDANKWKPRFECMKEVFNVLTGAEETNVEVKTDIADHKKAYVCLLMDAHHWFECLSDPISSRSSQIGWSTRTTYSRGSRSCGFCPN